MAALERGPTVDFGLLPCVSKGFLLPVLLWDLHKGKLLPVIPNAGVVALADSPFAFR